MSRCGVVLASVLALLAWAASASGQQPADGPLTPFYAAPAGADTAERGRLLRSAPIASDKLLPGAGRGWTVLYASRGYRDQPVVVSGLVYVPEGRPPKGGWPVISYAHGTVGVVNRCAPSYRQDLAAWMGEYLKAGFALVATDYEGLGPAGPHPYLDGRSEAYGQIDIVRAARQLVKGLSRQWMAVGQSQGGQATLFTAASATRLAPELRFRGAIATAPPSHWGIQVVETTDVGRVLTPLVLDALTLYQPDLDVPSLLTAEGRVLRDATHEGCLADTVLSVFPEVLGKPLIVDDPATAYARLKPLFDRLEPPIVKLDQPLYLADGADDEFVPTRTVVMLAGELRAKGSEVALDVFPGVDHRGSARAALTRGIAFARKRFGRSIYQSLSLRFTSHRPGTATDVAFTSALPAPPEGFSSPAMRRSVIRFPKGTRLDTGAVPACPATDADLAQRGVAACPPSSRIGTGSAEVRIGTGGTLPLAAHAFNGPDRTLTIALTQPDGTVLRVLHPTVGARTVTTVLPKVELGAGAEASLTRLSLRLGARSGRRALVRTPPACPRGGRWTIAYTSAYDPPIGTQTVRRATRC